MKIVCREIDKFNGGEPSYYILACKVTADVVKNLDGGVLQIRNFHIS